MNVSDTEIAWSILQNEGYSKAESVAQVKLYFCLLILLTVNFVLFFKQADVILAVTCSIRENAEFKIWNRLDYFKSIKKKRSRHLPPLKIGVLGKINFVLVIHTQTRFTIGAKPHGCEEENCLLLT